MKATTANLLNSIILIFAGIYGYFGFIAADGHHSPTALIPTVFGVLLIILGCFWERSPKIISHTVVLLTLVLLIMCSMRFIKVENWNAKKYLFLVCIFSNAIALAIFIKSFIDARKTVIEK